MLEIALMRMVAVGYKQAPVKTAFPVFAVNSLNTAENEIYLWSFTVRANEPQFSRVSTSE